MNAKQAKRLRKRARELTPHLPERTYAGNRLTECTRGAYKALKSGRYRIADDVALPSQD